MSNSNIQILTIGITQIFTANDAIIYFYLIFFLYLSISLYILALIFEVSFSKLIYICTYAK